MKLNYYLANIKLFAMLSIFVAVNVAAQQNDWQGRSGTLAEPTEDYQEGLFPYGTSYYEFSQDGTGVHHLGSDTSSQQIRFQYSVGDDQQLLITERELRVWLWNNFPSNFWPYRSDFYYYAVDTWGQSVADAIEACDPNGSQWWGKIGVESEEWQVISDVDGIATVEISQSYVEILEVSDFILQTCADWNVDTRPIARKTLPTVTRYFQYQENQSSLFHQLTEDDFIGAWAIPIRYFLPSGENTFFGSRDFTAGYQDKIVFGQDNAVAQHSGHSFSWSLENGVLTLERDNEKFEYTASQGRGQYYQVTVKRYENNQLAEIFNSQMAKFAFHDIGNSLDLNDVVLQDYPMVWGSTIGVRNKDKYNNELPTCDNLFFLSFFDVNRIGIFGRCSTIFNDDLQRNVEYYRYSAVNPHARLAFDEELEEVTLVEDRGYSLSNRIWQVVDFIDDTDLLVLQHRRQLTDRNNDGELDPSEEYIEVQPDLVIYRRMDLSKNEEAWANTDSDDDALSNPREQELGTDMLNPDSDGDGISDGDEVSNGTNPLRNNNIVFVPFDYDGDGKADVGVRRPSTSLQYILNSSNDEIQRVTFGLQAGDIPVSGDFDGDGIADVAVRRPSNFTWYILNSSDGEIQRIVFARDSDDIPVPADYDGDGITDVAVRRASSQMWYILNSSDGEIQRINFGLQETDIPVPADYDGDGKADVAVRRASNQMWYILNSSDGEIQRIQFGLQEADIPVPADFDGDGKADVAVRRASNQMWYILNSSDAEIQRIKFGLQEGDVPIVADYDGDGKADVAVRRPSTQLQYILRSSDDQIERIHFGRQSGDIALAAPVSIKMQMLADSASQEAGSSAPESAQRVLLTSEQ